MKNYKYNFTLLVDRKRKEGRKELDLLVHLAGSEIEKYFKICFWVYIFIIQ